MSGVTLTDRERKELDRLFGFVPDPEPLQHMLAAVERIIAARLKPFEALAEKWRYKGEFGWGPWQEGHGPDHEGWVLDEASSELRAAIEEARRG